MAARIFIDGEAGTTGLQLRDRLTGRRDFEILSIAPDKRKDPLERKRLLNAADVAILCLPDEAAKESVSLIENGTTKVIDASTAHRVADGWTYGFAEMDRDQSKKIAGAMRVSNPGCWPQGGIATLRPLISAGLIPADFPVIAYGISGYSGGYSKLTNAPLFTPAVGNFRQGMIVTVPLQLSTLSKVPTGAQLHAAIADHYAAISDSFVEVAALADTSGLNPQLYNDTNRMRLHVFANDQTAQAVLVAVYDNLGKGASGAAVQNLNLMLGVAADTSLAA